MAPGYRQQIVDKRLQRGKLASACQRDLFQVFVRDQEKEIALVVG